MSGLSPVRSGGGARSGGRGGRRRQEMAMNCIQSIHKVTTSRSPLMVAYPDEHGAQMTSFDPSAGWKEVAP
jgi:hypothetical protein